MFVSIGLIASVLNYMFACILHFLLVTQIHLRDHIAKFSIRCKKIFSFIAFLIFKLFLFNSLSRLGIGLDPQRLYRYILLHVGIVKYLVYY